VTVRPLLLRSLRYGAVLTLIVAAGGGLLGFLAAATPGLAGGLLGGALSGLFLALTALSILLAGRVSNGDLTSPAFLGVVLGVWTLKLILFFVLSLWLRGQDWIDPGAFGITAIVGVLGSLVADVVAFQRSRIPLDVVLPDDERSGE
jgi:hypothetical protein